MAQKPGAPELDVRQNIVVIADEAHGSQFGFGGEVNEKTINIFHCFHFLKDEGVMAIILPHGVLFRGGAEERIRTKLLNDGHIDTVIGLPANLFYSTGTPSASSCSKSARSTASF